MSRPDESTQLERLCLELVQVAAVAVAIVEDLTYGEANFEAPGDDFYGTSQTEQVLAEVHSERLEQDKKWGPQHHSAFDWLMILAEEFGEAAEEVRGPDDPQHLYLQAQMVKAGSHARRYLEARFG